MPGSYLQVESLPPGPGDLDDLDAAREARRAPDLVAQLRIGQAEHLAKRQVRVRVGRLALELEADTAVKRDGLFEIRDDRAVEIPRADDEARGRRTCGRARRRLRVDDAPRGRYCNDRACSSWFPRIAVAI